MIYYCRIHFKCVFFLPLGDFTVVELSPSNISAVFISPSVYSRLNNYLTKFCLLIKPKITHLLHRERKFDIIGWKICKSQKYLEGSVYLFTYPLHPLAMGHKSRNCLLIFFISKFDFLKNVYIFFSFYKTKI